MATQTPPDVWAFLKEIVSRLKSKNPKFFNVLAWISAIAYAVTGLPAVIASIPGITLPATVIHFENSAVAIASAVVFIMSNLAVASPASTTLPFTDKTAK